jgi:DNA topoisomerase-3
MPPFLYRWPNPGDNVQAWAADDPDDDDDLTYIQVTCLACAQAHLEGSGRWNSNPRSQPWQACAPSVLESNSSQAACPRRHSLRDDFVHYMFYTCWSNRFFQASVMADQIVITEKSSQAKDVRAAVGSLYGDVLAAEGHLFDLLEPEDVVPAWKRWSPILLRPEGLYGTRPAEGGNKAAKLRAIREALRTARRVWLATDCDREGQLIGQEILEHYEYRGQVMRVLFTAQDSQTIRDAFGRAKPNSEYARFYAAAVARRQADQIYNLSLTRTATVILGQGARRVIGVGRVKTPTLAIVCKRELEIRNFVPLAYFEVVATAKVTGGQFQMRHAPQDRIVRREIAQEIAEAARGFEGALAVRVEDKRQGPPKLHDLPSLQKLCGSRFGWPASRTLEVAQELYDGAGKKIITYPRAEVRYLPQSLMSDVPRIVAGLRVGQSFSTIPVPEPPVIRKGASLHFLRQGAGGCEPSRRYSQRQHDRQIAGSMASLVAR